VNRTVFYLPGFDPRGAKFYHRLYREQAERQQLVNGLIINVGMRGRIDSAEHRWRIAARDAQGTTVNVDYRYLAWDDIVRKHWVKSPLRILLALVRLVRVYVLSGVILRVARLAKGPAITGLYPAVYLILATLFLLVLGGFTGQHLAVVLGLAGSREFYFTLASIFFFCLLGYPLAVWVGEKLNVFWLLRIYQFSDRWVYQGDSDLEARLDLFAAKIGEVLEDPDVDEVLVVGHSVGALLLAPTVSRLIEARRDCEKLRVLSLGHCVPVVSELPQAGAYRRAVEQCGEVDTLHWYDFSAARDGACFYGISPLYNYESEEKRGPVVCMTARFHTLFSDDSYQRLKSDWYQLHFQYLMAAELPGLMDYYRFTASPVPFLNQLEGQFDSRIKKVAA